MEIIINPTMMGGYISNQVYYYSLSNLEQQVSVLLQFEVILQDYSIFLYIDLNYYTPWLGDLLKDFFNALLIQLLILDSFSRFLIMLIIFRITLQVQNVEVVSNDFQIFNNYPTIFLYKNVYNHLIQLEFLCIYLE